MGIRSPMPHGHDSPLPCRLAGKTAGQLCSGQKEFSASVVFVSGAHGGNALQGRHGPANVRPRLS